MITPAVRGGTPGDLAYRLSVLIALLIRIKSCDQSLEPKPSRCGQLGLSEPVDGLWSSQGRPQPYASARLIVSTWLGQYVSAERIMTSVACASVMP